MNVVPSCALPRPATRRDPCESGCCVLHRFFDQIKRNVIYTRRLGIEFTSTCIFIFAPSTESSDDFFA